MSDNIALGRETSVCIVPEVTVGTIATPTSAHAVLISDGGTFGQTGNFLEDEQKRPTRSRFGRVRGKYEPGEWSFGTYLKPQTPVAGVANNEHLFEGLLGTRVYNNVTNGTLVIKGVSGPFTAGETLTGSVTGNCTLGTHDGCILNCSAVTAAFAVGETVTGGTSGSTGTIIAVLSGNVNFTPKNLVGSYSIWARIGHTVLVNTGATVNQGAFTINGVDIGSASWSGQFIKQIWTGTDPLATGITALATTATVTDADLFSIDSRIHVINHVTGAIVDDNGGLGYHVSAVDTATNIITIDDAGGFDATTASTDHSIAPWFPVITDAGAIVHGRVGAVNLDNAVVSVTDSSITINNNLQYIVDEKDGSDYPSFYNAPANRTVEASAGLYFRQENLKYFNIGVNAAKAVAQFPLGTVSGSRLTIWLPNSVLDIPALDSGDMVKLTTTIRGEASVPEVPDEVAFIFD